MQFQVITTEEVRDLSQQPTNTPLDLCGLDNNITAISIASDLPYRKIWEDMMAMKKQMLEIELERGPENKVNYKVGWERYISETLGWVLNTPPPRDSEHFVKRISEWSGFPNTALITSPHSGLHAVRNGRVLGRYWYSDVTKRPLGNYWTPPEN